GLRLNLMSTARFTKRAPASRQPAKLSSPASVCRTSGPHRPGEETHAVEANQALPVAVRGAELHPRGAPMSRFPAKPDQIDPGPGGGAGRRAVPAQTDH